MLIEVAIVSLVTVLDCDFFETNGHISIILDRLIVHALVL